MTTEGLVKRWLIKDSENTSGEKTCLVAIYHLWQCDFTYDFIYIHITGTGHRLLHSDSSVPFTITKYNPAVWLQELIWGPVHVFRLKVTKDFEK